MIDVAVVGASGYIGGELLRLLSRHPEARIALAISESNAGMRASTVFPGMVGRVDVTLTGADALPDAGHCHAAFLAMENGKAMRVAGRLLDQGCKVIDLSADFRFRDAGLYETWYGTGHTAPVLARDAVYGLPELYRDAVRKATLVGNPGCYPTAAIIALAPLLKEQMIDPATIVIDAKSGVSGAGRAKTSLEYHFPEVTESVSAYKIAGTHRHTAEIEQALAEAAGTGLHVTFTPHLVPMARGILATCYANLADVHNTSAVTAALADFYAREPFVAVVPDHLPATKHTLGNNMCHIGVAVDARTNRVTVLAAIDNLVKGAAGQAIQNLNILFGLEETMGLEAAGLWP